jgi:hypothetical protein
MIPSPGMADIPLSAAAISLWTMVPPEETELSDEGRDRIRYPVEENVYGVPGYMEKITDNDDGFASTKVPA